MYVYDISSVVDKMMCLFCGLVLISLSQAGVGGIVWSYHVVTYGPAFCLQFTFYEGVPHLFMKRCGGPPTCNRL